jgi:hypothetical protein
MGSYLDIVVEISFGLFFLYVSKSKWWYQKMRANNDEKFSNTLVKYLKIAGYLLVGLCLLQLVYLYFSGK